LTENLEINAVCLLIRETLHNTTDMHVDSGWIDVDIEIYGIQSYTYKNYMKRYDKYSKG